jgi:hypothetical protein
MGMKPKWRLAAEAKYRRALRRAGHSSYKSAWLEYVTLLGKHCTGILSPEKEIRFESLHTLRRLKMACEPSYHRHIQSVKRKSREIQKEMAVLIDAISSRHAG